MKKIQSFLIVYKKVVKLAIDKHYQSVLFFSFLLLLTKKYFDKKKTKLFIN